MWKRQRRPPMFRDERCHFNFIFLVFVFQVCAIVGGTFTVAGIIDSMIFTASELFKKAQMGKLS